MPNIVFYIEIDYLSIDESKLLGSNEDGIVKTIFSRKVAKNAKKNSLNINPLTLRLGVRF